MTEILGTTHEMMPSIHPESSQYCKCGAHLSWTEKGKLEAFAEHLKSVNWKPVAPEPTKECEIKSEGTEAWRTTAADLEPGVALGRDTIERDEEIAAWRTLVPGFEEPDRLGEHVQNLESELTSLRDERDQARDLAIKVECRYQDVLKELAELRGKIEMLTTPDPDFDGERGFYDGI